MKITKSDFKIIFNKIINNSNDKNMKILQNLSNNSNLGDSQIDNLVNIYSSDYVSKVINKILKNNLIGGETSEEPPRKNSSLLDLPLSETSIEPPKFINIIDMTAGNGDKKDLSQTNQQNRILSLFKRSSSPSPSTENSATSPLMSMQPASTSPTSSEPRQSGFSSFNRQTKPTSSLMSKQPASTSPTSSEPRQPRRSSLRSNMQPASTSPTSSEPRQFGFSSLRSNMRPASTSPTSSEPKQSAFSSLRSNMRPASTSPTSSEPKQSGFSSLRSNMQPKPTSSLISMQLGSTSPTSSEPRQSSHWSLKLDQKTWSPTLSRSQSPINSATSPLTPRSDRQRIKPFMPKTGANQNILDSTSSVFMPLKKYPSFSFNPTVPINATGSRDNTVSPTLFKPRSFTRSESLSLNQGKESSLVKDDPSMIYKILNQKQKLLDAKELEIQKLRQEIKNLNKSESKIYENMI